MTVPLYTQTIRALGQPLIKGNAVLIAGTNVTLTQTGKEITIAASGGGGGAVDSVNGQTGVVVLAKSDIGLGNVDNTSDLNKPISTATQTALDGKANAGASPSIATVEKDLGAIARLSGKFTITGLSGLTIGKPVMIQQAVAPYTGKGTQADESEMDGIVVKAVVTAVDTITAYWNSATRVKKNIKFNYFVGV